MTGQLAITILHSLSFKSGLANSYQEDVWPVLTVYPAIVWLWVIVVKYKNQFELASKQARKARQKKKVLLFYRFLKLIQINLIFFRQSTYIVYLFYLELFDYSQVVEYWHKTMVFHHKKNIYHFRLNNNKMLFLTGFV